MIKHTKQVALANKEVLVTGGSLIMNLAKECNTELFTVDNITPEQALNHPTWKMGPKDMQIPIAYALNYPTRLENRIEKLDLFEVQTLKFEKPDLEKFKCLKLAFKAIEMGHSAQVVLNAANEVAVKKFWH